MLDTLRSSGTRYLILTIALDAELWHSNPR
jgi:hypothetical protein